MDNLFLGDHVLRTQEERDCVACNQQVKCQHLWWPGRIPACEFGNLPIGAATSVLQFSSSKIGSHTEVDSNVLLKQGMLRKGTRGPVPFFTCADPIKFKIIS